MKIHHRNTVRQPTIDEVLHAPAVFQPYMRYILSSVTSDLHYYQQSTEWVWSGEVTTLRWAYTNMHPFSQFYRRLC